jgi:hypothetical protein
MLILAVKRWKFGIFSAKPTFSPIGKVALSGVTILMGSAEKIGNFPTGDTQTREGGLLASA